MKPTLSLLLLALACCSSDANQNGIGAPICPRDWIYFDGHCYSLKKVARKWNAAEGDCQTYGPKSHLASILSKKENKHLASVIAGELSPGFRIWIGLHRVKKGGRIELLRWADNSNVDYAAWADGKPKTRGYCVEIFGDGYDKWNGAGCDTENYYMCKISLS